MFYGPFGTQFEAAQRDNPESIPTHNEHEYHSVLVHNPHVIRWSTAQHTWENPKENPVSPDMLTKVANERAKHLGYLATLGLHIPNHQSLIGESPFIPGTAVLYDRVDYITGDNLTDIDDPGTLNKLGTILENYLKLCTELAERRYMNDLFCSGQYVLTDDNCIYLMDIEPVFASMDVGRCHKGMLEDAHTHIEHYKNGEQW